MEALGCLTVDVEEYHQAENLQGAGLPHSWLARESRVELGTHRILELLATKGVRATFFVLGWIAEHFPGLVREIHRGGHELATHGYSHRQLPKLGPRLFAEELRRSTLLIEDLTGDKVLGHRAASFSLTRETWWALEILQGEGLTYDSSLFPICYGARGMRELSAGPFVVPGGLWEFPIPSISLLKWKVPVVGGGYLRMYPYSFTRWAMRKVQAEGHPAIVYVHPWEVDPGQPRLRVPNSLRFRHYVNLERTRITLERLLEDFHFLPIREVLSVLKTEASDTP